MEHKTAPASKIRVGIAGLGAIGKSLARTLDNGGVPGCRLAAVSGRDPDKTASFVAGLCTRVPVVALGELADHSDIVIECAPSALLREIVEPVIKAGKKVVVLSVGALLGHPDLLNGEVGPGQIMVPTGALLGLDAVVAAAEGTIHSVRMVTRKPPLGLLGAPYLEKERIDITGLKAPLKIFDGSPREAAVGFPANLNVAVALSLAGIGPDRTRLEIWADPTVTRNTHHIVVDSDSAKFSMTIENIPSENPKTGLITVQSIVAMLRKLSAPVRIGT
jgi:aspartate dehydrogenase